MQVVFHSPPTSRAQHAVHRRESGDDKPGAGAIAGAWATREDLLETKKVGALHGNWHFRPCRKDSVLVISIILRTRR